MKKGVAFSFLTFLFCLTMFGQSPKIDSLLLLIKKDKADTNRLFYLVKVAREFDNHGYYDSAMVYALRAVEESKSMLSDPGKKANKRTIQKCLGDAYNALGIAYDDAGNYPKALEHYATSLKIREEIGDLKGQGGSYNNIGIIYEHQGNYPEALKFHFKSLKVDDILGSKQGMANSYTNIGNVYADQANYPDALKNHLLALKLSEDLGDKHGMGVAYNNIGLAHYYMLNYEDALRFHTASLELRIMLGEQRGTAISSNNIGLVYYDLALAETDLKKKAEHFDLALKNYMAALKAQKDMGENATLGNLYNNIGNVYIKKKQFNEAEGYLLKAKKILMRIGYREYLRGTFRALYSLDSARGNYESAFANYNNFILYRDSLNNEESHNKSVQSQMTYDFEKKEAIAKAEYKKELENQHLLSEEKSRKQKIVLVMVTGFLLLVLFFAGFIFRSLNITRKQKKIIEEQKQLVEDQKLEVEMQKLMVEEHQKEIIDSIHYAKRIQQSLLPTELYIERSIKRLRKE